ncbi:MAG: Ig-like domain-containing protein [Pseudomonadota bacterium]
MFNNLAKILTLFLILIMLGFGLGNGIGGCTGSKSVAPGPEEGDGTGTGDGSGGVDEAGGIPAASLNLNATTNKLYTTDPLRITFNQAMNQATTQAAVSITDASGAAVNGTFSWNGNDLIFTPNGGLWRTNHAYNLSISVAATNQAGTALAQALNQTFRPQLNLHDVNGDKIDDFMLGMPGGNAGGVEDSGQAYLFLGRQSWEGANLTSANALYTVESDAEFGWEAKVVGDINGDGFADMLIAAPSVSVAIDAPGPGVGVVDNGLVAIIHGSANPANLTLSMAQLANGIIVGPDDESRLGFPVKPVGDVNGDGLADFVIGSKTPADDTRFFLFLGRKEGFPNWASAAVSASATYILAEDERLNGVFQTAGCDINGDGFSDLLFGAPGFDGGFGVHVDNGEVYIIAGSQTPTSLDLRAEAPSAVISGANDNDRLGVVACGNINGDQYADLVLGAPGFDASRGAAYVILGEPSFRNYNLEPGGDTPFAFYQGPVAGADGVGELCVPGDVVNHDGYEDILIGALLMDVDVDNGLIVIMPGSTTGFNYTLVEANPPATYYIGENRSHLGSCKTIGDVNADGMADLLIGAPTYPDMNGWGRVYLIFGAQGVLPPVDFRTASTGITFTGDRDMDLLIVGPADL